MVYITYRTKQNQREQTKYGKTFAQKIFPIKKCSNWEKNIQNHAPYKETSVLNCSSRKTISSENRPNMFATQIGLEFFFFYDSYCNVFPNESILKLNIVIE